MKKRLLAIIMAVAMAFSFTACGTSDGKSTSAEDVKEKLGDTLKDLSGKEEEKPADVAKEHYEIDLSAGNYIAGTDIPVGTYNITATGGSGNVSSSNMFTGGLNEIMGSPAEEGYSIDSFNGLKMESGVTLTLGSTVTIHLVSEDAEVSSVTPRAVADATPIDLGAGNYTAGTDFPAGTYNLIATSGSGNVSSDNMYQGGLNEIMGNPAEAGFSISQYNNAIFEEGTVLSVSGASIQLVPVGE
jgi:predicted small secreted protein